MAYQVGDNVRWTSSNTDKQGIIVAVVPSKKTPIEMGFPKAGGGGIGRDHETYIIKGKKCDRYGKTYGSNALYWPHVSLLLLVEAA